MFKLTSLNLAIDQEAARVRCAQKCLERTKERDDALEQVAALTQERDQLRAKLAEYESAPTVAVVSNDLMNKILRYERGSLPRANTELIARPKVKE